MIRPGAPEGVSNFLRSTYWRSGVSQPLQLKDTEECLVTMSKHMRWRTVMMVKHGLITKMKMVAKR